MLKGRQMTNLELAVLLGLVGAALGGIAWYGGSHPPMAYQRERLAHATPEGLKRRNVAIGVLTVIFTAVGALIGSLAPLK